MTTQFRRALIDKRLGDRNPMRLKVYTEQTGVRVQLQPSLNCGNAVTLEIHPNDPPRLLRSDLLRGSNWAMTRGFCVRGGSKDVFQRLSRLAYAMMFDNWEVRGREPVLKPERERAQAVMRQVHSYLRDASIYAAELCDPRAKKVALRFAVHLRYRVYERVLADPSERIAELAYTCPGALIFALALIEQEGMARSGSEAESAGEQLLQAVVAGKSLTQALNTAIEAWAEQSWSVLEKQAQLGLQVRGQVWKRILEAAGEARGRICLQQRLLIRRAGPLVSTTLLWLPPPIAFTPEDIPKHVYKNAWWFRAMKSSGVTLHEGDEDEAPYRLALAQLVSGQSMELRGAIKKGQLRTSLNSLLDYLVSMRRMPSRRSDVVALLRESQAWHDRVAAVRDLADLAQEVPELETYLKDGVSLELPVLLPHYAKEDLEIAPIRTADELIAEGGRMRHCVASRLREALAGRRFYFHAQISGRPLTIEVERTRLGNRLKEVKGTANRDATLIERRRLEAWVSGN